MPGAAATANCGAPPPPRPRPRPLPRPRPRPPPRPLLGVGRDDSRRVWSIFPGGFAAAAGDGDVATPRPRPWPRPRPLLRPRPRPRVLGANPERIAAVALANGAVGGVLEDEGGTSDGRRRTAEDGGTSDGRRDAAPEPLVGTSDNRRGIFLLGNRSVTRYSICEIQVDSIFIFERSTRLRLRRASVREGSNLESKRKAYPPLAMNHSRTAYADYAPDERVRVRDHVLQAIVQYGSPQHPQVERGVMNKWRLTTREARAAIAEAACWRREHTRTYERSSSGASASASRGASSGASASASYGASRDVSGRKNGGVSGGDGGGEEDDCGK